jgi:hypothetical protein
LEKGGGQRTASCSSGVHMRGYSGGVEMKKVAGWCSAQRFQTPGGNVLVWQRPWATNGAAAGANSELRRLEQRRRSIGRGSAGCSRVHMAQVARLIGCGLHPSVARTPRKGARRRRRCAPSLQRARPDGPSGLAAGPGRTESTEMGRARRCGSVQKGRIFLLFPKITFQCENNSSED